MAGICVKKLKYHKNKKRLNITIIFVCGKNKTKIMCVVYFYNINRYEIAKRGILKSDNLTRI